MQTITNRINQFIRAVETETEKMTEGYTNADFSGYGSAELYELSHLAHVAGCRLDSISEKLRLIGIEIKETKEIGIRDPEPIEN